MSVNQSSHHPSDAACAPRPQILSVVFISDSRAAIKAGCADGVRWRITNRAEGERVAQELAAELRL